MTPKRINITPLLIIRKRILHKEYPLFICFSKEKGKEIPEINRNNGNMRSYAVNPCQAG